MEIPDSTIVQIGTDANGKFFLQNSAGRRYRPTHGLVIIRETQAGQADSPDVFSIYHADDKYYRSPLFKFDQANITSPPHTDADDLENQLLQLNPFFFSLGGGSGGVIVIQQNHVFTLFTDRDEYFDPTLPVGVPTDNTAELVANNTLILITGEGTDNIIQRWDGASDPANYDNGNWTDVTDTVRGPRGADGAPGAAGAPGADGADGTPGVQGPAGPSEVFIDSQISSASLAVDRASLATQNKRNLIYVGTGIATWNLDTIANFLADPVTDIQYRFINNSDGILNISAAASHTFGSTGNQTISLNRGQALHIKVPTSGTRFDILHQPSSGGIGTTPLGPTQLPQTGAFVLQTTPWDASSGTFPTGIISSGFVYRISAPGIVDNVTFRVDDLLLAITDNPLPGTFDGNWHRIDGTQDVHTWAGLGGVIDDNAITTVLTRLGVEFFAAPSAHNFTINIPSRVDVGTDLNVSHIINYDVTNRQNIASAQLIVNAGDNITLTTPTRDGPQTETIVNTGISSANPGTVEFFVRLTDTANNTHDSNTYTVTISTPASQEQTHFGFIISTEGETDIVFADDDIEARDTADGNYTVANIPVDSNLYRLYWAVPVADGSITSVTQSGIPITNLFTTVNNVSIGGELYNVTIMLAANAVNSTYNGTILTAA